MQHMREAHNFKLGEKKLLVLANRNVRKTTLFTSCPLCGKSETKNDGRLENHVAGHLRSLALKSLPPYQEDMEADVGSGRDSCDGSQLRSVKTTDDLSASKGSSTDRMNDELSKLSEAEDTDFVNDAPYDLDSRHTDMWNSWVNDWISNKPMLEHLQRNSDKDPILELMIENAGERAEPRDGRKSSNTDTAKDYEKDGTYRSLKYNSTIPPRPLQQPPSFPFASFPPYDPFPSVPPSDSFPSFSPYDQFNSSHPDPFPSVPSSNTFPSFFPSGPFPSVPPSDPFPSFLLPDSFTPFPSTGIIIGEGGDESHGIYGIRHNEREDSNIIDEGKHR